MPVTIDDVTYYSVGEALAKLPLPIREKEFRRTARESGHCLARGWRIVLTEAHINAVLAILAGTGTTKAPRARKAPTCRSSSSGGRAARTGTPRVQSAASDMSRARALLKSP